MKLFILLFGLFAALLGTLASIAALAIQVQPLIAGDRDDIDGVVFVALAVSALGLYGARLALRYPRLSSTVMTAAAIGGLLTVTWFYLIPALLLSIASALGFMWRNERAPSLTLG